MKGYQYNTGKLSSIVKHVNNKNHAAAIRMANELVKKRVDEEVKDFDIMAATERFYECGDMSGIKLAQALDDYKVKPSKTNKANSEEARRKYEEQLFAELFQSLVGPAN